MKHSRLSQSGQIVLITLLVLSIATTVALSLIARTTTDLTISSQVEESSRAFSAAEAGIEEALRSGMSAGPTSIVGVPGTTYSVAVSNLGGAVGIYTIPRKTVRGTTETIWLAAHNSDGTIDESNTVTAGSLNLCWSQEPTTIPAVVVTILYKRGAGYFIAKGAYDPDGTRIPLNKFSGVTALSGGCGLSTMYRQLITFSDFGITPAIDKLLMMRVRPAYSDTQFAVDSAPVVLPLQGRQIESTGYTGAGVTRQILVYQQYRSAPTIFDAALYSQNTLTQ